MRNKTKREQNYEERAKGQCADYRLPITCLEQKWLDVSGMQLGPTPLCSLPGASASRRGVRRKALAAALNYLMDKLSRSSITVEVSNLV